jgi:hypothetical protein
VRAVCCAIPGRQALKLKLKLKLVAVPGASCRMLFVESSLTKYGATNRSPICFVTSNDHKRYDDLLRYGGQVNFADHPFLPATGKNCCVTEEFRRCLCCFAVLLF